MNDRKKAAALAAKLTEKSLRYYGGRCKYHGNAECDCALRKARRVIRGQGERDA